MPRRTLSSGQAGQAAGQAEVTVVAVPDAPSKGSLFTVRSASSVAVSLAHRLSRSTYGALIPKTAASLAPTVSADTSAATPMPADGTNSGISQDALIAAVSTVSGVTFGNASGAAGSGLSLSAVDIAAPAPKKKPSRNSINAKGERGRLDGAVGITHAYGVEAAQPSLIAYGGAEGIHTGTLAASGQPGGAARTLGAAAEKVLDKSVMLHSAVGASGGVPFEKRQRYKAVPVSERKDAGKKWFNLPAQEMTAEIKKDLLILRNREYLDPKHHYKGGATAEMSGPLPRFFAIGTVQEGAHERFSGRMVRKERKNTLVEGLLADERFRRYAKKQYDEVAAKAKASGRGSSAYGKRKAVSGGRGGFSGNQNKRARH